MGSTPSHGTMEFKVGDIISYKREPWITHFGVGIILSQPQEIGVNLIGNRTYYIKVYWFSKKEHRTVNTRLLKKNC